MPKLPVSAILPTKDRTAVLQRTIDSIFAQSHIPAQLIIVDASSDRSTEVLIESIRPAVPTTILYIRAATLGAAPQRMQGLDAASEQYILFADDDIVLEPACLERLFNGFSQGDQVGAVSSMITNQSYKRPGSFTRFMFGLMSGERRDSFAGRLIGPAWNMLPEDRDDLPEYVPCDWLNTTCTMYKRDRMPTPVFSSHFTGYSMFEDVTLSFTIGKKYRLLNARTARIFHDSQSGSKKQDIARMSAMEMVNRYYVMTRVLEHKKIGDYLKFWIFTIYGLLPALKPSRWRILPALIVGRIRGAIKILIS